MRVVKVCGTTNAEDALTACREGANFIGVIFVPKSKRCVTAEQAKEVVQNVRKFGERTAATEFPETPQSSDSPLASLVAKSRVLEDITRRPLVVGVFQNQSPGFIKQMVSECGLDMVQLHGNEGMMAASKTNCGAPAIRVVDIETDPETGKAASNAVNILLESITSDPVAILLDTSIKGSKEGGGTGVTFDWSIAEKIQSAGLPVIIAGGLTPENVEDAVSSVRPWGVDVSSGLEASPGKKDHAKIKAFVQGARDAAREASKGI
jgi:anthranilate synthase/indole-3-glycerol phosphate synthase/phosphoribosylanthranilate isomerase